MFGKLNGEINYFFYDVYAYQLFKTIHLSNIPKDSYSYTSNKSHIFRENILIPMSIIHKSGDTK